MKRFLRSLFSLLLVLPTAAPACFIYTTNNSAITITGYTGPGGDVRIPSTTNGLPVTSIGLWAFAYCSSVTNVTIPSSVTSIGVRAFYACGSLAALTVDPHNPVYSSAAGVLFRNSQTTLLQYPMAKRGGYTIPNSVTSIGDNAFSACGYLTNVTIGSNVTSIGSYAFYACGSLASVTIREGVTGIGRGAFHSCGLTSITIPNSATSIGDVAFEGCIGLTNVTIPNSVTNIGYYAFCYCTSLPHITIPDSVASIGVHAFDSCCSLTNVTLGTNVTTIGDNTFASCTSLAGVVIPDSVTAIGMGAFSWCTALSTVTIPRRVSLIEDATFEHCTNLAGVYFQGNAPDGVGAGTFLAADKATVYYLPGTVGWNPQVQTSGASFGVRTNRFGFTITGTSALATVVEACTNLANPIWSPVKTNTFKCGSSYFSDPEWTNYPARFYRLWDLTFAGRPAMLWRPQLQTGGASSAVRTNQFGFTITWASGQSIVVEACTNLVNPIWSPLQTNTLTSGSSYFSDPEWTNYPARFYRLRSP